MTFVLKAVTNNPPDERRSRRSKVVLAATMKWDGLSTSVRIANLSPNGALVFTTKVPPQDKEVALRSGTFEIRGWVAWVGECHAGINFDTPIKLSDVLPQTRTGAAMIVRDERTKDFRRPGLRGNQLSPDEQRMLEEWKRGY